MDTAQGPRMRSSDLGSVVFADDGAPAADAAWAWIISHVWQGWRLETVTVHETLLPGGPPIGDSQHVERRPPAEAQFEAWQHVDADGDPRVVLLDQRNASLVVVGCHHRTHVAGMLAGSTTEWLVTGTPFPLLVARHGHRTRSAAICVDGSRHAQRALEVFTSLPWSADVDVCLISVDDGSTDVEQALASAAAVVPGENMRTVVRPVGPAKRSIPEYVRKHRIDVVVLGTRGLTGLKRMVVGSTVSALLKDGAANLLIAHVGGDRG